MHFGNVVSVPQALFISLFSMVIVFLVLLCISYIIDLTAKFIKNKQPEKPVARKTAQTSADSDETVAIIAAAVATFEEGRDFKIKDIKQIDASWINSSRNASVK